MVLYDLSGTAIARSDRPIRPPGDVELFAITAGLLLVENRGFEELANLPLKLTERNRRRVAELLEERAPSLAREFGGPLPLRNRLRDLIGLRVSR
ncbi:MAG: hypothetical protein KDA32_10265 [Phycisphaerales bacterium]|nr:hypothetical protein [Phycisphaerales bacterium]